MRRVLELSIMLVYVLLIVLMAEKQNLPLQKNCWVTMWISYTFTQAIRLANSCSIAESKGKDVSTRYTSMIVGILFVDFLSVID